MSIHVQTFFYFTHIKWSGNSFVMTLFFRNCCADATSFLSTCTHTHTANTSTKTFRPSEDPILMRWRSFCFCKGVLCVCGCNVVASLFCPTFVTEIKDKHYILEVFLVLATNIAFPCRFLKLLTRVLAHAQHHEQNENRLI